MSSNSDSSNSSDKSRTTSSSSSSKTPTKRKTPKKSKTSSKKSKLSKESKTKTSKTIKLTPPQKEKEKVNIPHLSDEALAKLFTSLDSSNTNKTHFVGTAQIVLAPNLGVPGILPYTWFKKATSTLKIPSLTTALLSLSDGSIFSIGYFSIIRDSYAQRLRNWKKGDVIHYEYYGSMRARLFSGNLYVIRNVTRDTYIMGDKLEAMF